MNQELLVKASPWDVARLAYDLRRRTQLNKKASQVTFGPFHVVNWEQVKANPDVDPIYVDIEGVIDATDQTDGVNRTEKLLGFPGRVEAYRVPGGKSRLILTVKDEYWSAVAPNWKLLYQGMQQLGWIDRAEILTHEATGILDGNSILSAQGVSLPSAEDPIDSEARMNGPKPWESIPNHSWDRLAVQMLWEGYTDPEIGSTLKVTSKTITNRLSQLRQLYPMIVPTRREVRRHHKT